MLKTIEELKIDGWKALIQSLGLAEATRFMLQFQKGSGNYSLSRKKLFDNLSVNEIAKELKSK